MIESEIVADLKEGMSDEDAAEKHSASIKTIQLIRKRSRLAERKKPHKPRRLQPSGGEHARFKTPPIPPAGSVFWELPATHVAITDGRTLFPSRVVDPLDSPRYLIDGKNNAKTGGMVTKGPWKDMPIYTLTLEERATCPRSCHMYQGCYGNGMQAARRADHRHEDFIPALMAEVITVARQHPEGFVVRLHILGDFFSPKYVLMWAELLFMCPTLRIFGYTARRLDDPDPETRKIARALKVLTDTMWHRFAIRTSHPDHGPQHAVVVNGLPIERPDAVICPASTGDTACCSTCDLCWLPAFRTKTIEFLRHGRVLKGAPST